MSKIVLDVSVSLDGFAAGPNIRDAEPMGDGGEHLHDWMAAAGPDGKIDAAIAEQVNANIGAIIVGRRTFDLGLKNWGGTPWPGIPTYVVTHRSLEDFRGDNGGTFSFDGLEAAARRAREAAGDREVRVLGPDVARQLLRAGLLDEIWIHIAPILLGAGTPLFEGERAELVPVHSPVTGHAAHFFFRVGRQS
jgi:dihydrofolate reductase